MNFIRNLTIRRKLIAVTMITSTAAVLLGGMIFIVFSSYMHRQGSIHDLTSLAAVAGRSCQGALVFDIPRDAKKILAALTERPSVVHACVYDADGKVFALRQYGDDGGEFVAPPVGARAYEFTGGHLEVFHPVVVDGERIGTVYLRDDLRAIRAGFRRDVAILVAVMILSLTAAWCIGSRLQAVISGPILALTDTALAVRQGRDYSVRAVKESEDEIGHLIDAFNDMLTQIQHRDGELCESSRRFASTFNQAAVGIAHIAPDGKFIRINRRFCDTVGYTRDELLDRTFQEITYPDDLERTEEMVARIVDGEVASYTIEKRYLRKDRSVVWVDLTVALVRDIAGEPEYLISVIEEITARKQAEQALYESERLFRDFFENAPVGFHMFGPDRIITDINEAELAMIGYNRDEIVGKKTWADLIIPEQKQQFEKHWHDITTKGRVRDLEYTLVHKSGFTVNVVLNASSRFDDDGNLITTRGSVLNITRRKRVEKDLSESRQMLELILDTIPTHVFWKDRESIFLGCNRHFAEDAGLKSSGEIVGRTDFDLTWKEQAPLYRADDKAVIESGQPKIDYEEPQTWYDGTSLWLRTSKMPLRDSEDNIIGILGTYEDITERKRAEETLKYRFELEEVITTISAEFINLKSYEIDDAIDRALKAVAEAVCVDRSYVFLYSDNGKKVDNTNEWCRDGVSPHKQRLQGLDVDIFPWFDERMKSRQAVVVPCVADLGEEMEAEKAEWQLEATQSLLCVPIVCKDRLVGFIGFDTVFYQTDWAEDIVKFLTIVGNIFANALDRKISEQERELLVKTLAAKNKELQSVVYVASHDLRSPLINIQGFSGELVKSCRQLLEYLGLETISANGREGLKPILEEDIPQALEFITASTDKMQTLLNGLLKISRIGTSSLKIEPLDMNQLVKKVVDAMSFQIQSCDAVVTVDELPPCLGDAGRTSQVFSNLLDNAVKYLDPGREGRIRVTGRSEDNRCIYCVEDNGVGIDEDYQAKVFEIFHRLDPDGGVPGEGLGLTIISRILDRQDGNILLDSKPGRGSRFSVSLPSVSA